MLDTLDTLDAATPQSRLLSLISASWTSNVLCAAVQLGIPELLAAGPRPLDEIVAATSCHPGALARFMQALVSLDVCREEDDGRFALTAMGTQLRRDVPDSFHAWTLYWSRFLQPVWAYLADSVKSGQSVRKTVTGFEGFERQKEDPEAAALFNKTMVELSRLVARDVAGAYDFGTVRHVMDVGGGYGELLATLLVRWPHLSGTLFDLEHAMAGARERLAAAGLTSRTACVAGDFFESVPGGADVYVMKSVVHDWPDDKAALILANCRRAMPDQGRLLLVERVRPERLEPTPLHQSVARSDLLMLIGLGAQERTEPEFRRLLAGAGFEIRDIRPLGMAFSLIECVAVGQLVAR